VRGVGRGKAGGVPGNRLLPRPRGGGAKGRRVRQQVAHRYWQTQKYFLFLPQSPALRHIGDT
jgi:hypothetical protein